MARRPAVRRSPHGLRTRELVEPDQLRAMAHPRRLDLLDLLAAEGPLTATECAERLDDSPASCSYHLRQLARFGFVEEAPGGTGRRRPWRWVPIGNRVPVGDSPARQAAADELFTVLDARTQDRLRQFRRADRSDPWIAAGDTSDYSFLLTKAEITELVDQINGLLAPLQQRTFDNAAPDGARMVDVVSLVLPRGGERGA